MAMLLAWKQPKAAADLELQHTKKAMQQLGFRYLLWWVALGGLAVYIVYRLEPQAMPHTLKSIAITAVGLPLYVLAMVKLCASCTQYELRDKGVCMRFGHTVFHRWRDVEGYRLTDDPELPGIRRFEFKSRWSQHWREWHYDPSEVDETRLRAILEEHLPGKCWDGVGSGDRSS